ncbi:MAG: 2-amino-4-hydroxy-6-hydroxymethyldihydropteridine diphosphokinase [Fimbriimonadaceae bacterium]|nr:2-amino-4-hydroxy-6-hydroxymethyldihydropteridine diphosphokinase [Fimbriimonadaceae bacterium]
MYTVLVALGGNLGDRLAAMQRALDAAAREIVWSHVSSIYETDPMYRTDQPAFLNAAAMGTTHLPALDCLRFLKSIEQELGREDGPRNGPRVIDLDLIDHSERETRAPEMVLPHPRAHERRFVLAPLAEFAEDWVIGGAPIAAWLAQTESQSDAVRKLAHAVLSLPSPRPER